LDLKGNEPQKLSIYFSDWDAQGREEVVEMFDSKTGRLLSSETIAAFTGGVYLSWSVQGPVRIRCSTSAGSNSVMSALFVD